jgi:uncharacterized protein
MTAGPATHENVQGFFHGPGAATGRPGPTFQPYIPMKIRNRMPAAIAGRLAACCLLPLVAGASDDPVDYPVKPVPFTDVSFTAGLWRQRQETNHRVTLPFALGQLESSKRMLNFDLAAETMRRRAAGEKSFQNTPPTQYPFDDSDVTKVLEGAAFSYSVRPDPALAARMEAMIARVAAAQEADGYLFTFRTMHPDSPAHPWIGRERWLKDPGLSHELYNLGHMFEAGVAHARATGSDSLLDVCLKSAGLLHRDFGDGRLVVAPGHQVVEMGLAKLFRITGDQRWLELARIFLEARGRSGGGTEYSQDHLPVTRQREAVGHAVRANYLYSGMADVAALKGDRQYLEAITAIWENVVGKKLHLTGGCGARGAGEAYGDNYELPHRCYNETCAAIAFLFWNHRMFLMTGDGKFMDVFERTLFNGFLSGVSLGGDRFFYPNPLEYDGKEANNHGHAGRAPWFGCACCPPNILRTMASLGGYVYAVRDRDLFVNLYAQGEARAGVAARTVGISQETQYPWNGVVKLTVRPEGGPHEFALCLRVPGWVAGRPLPTDLYHYANPEPAAWTIKVNGTPVQAGLTDGYARIRRTWQPGDVVELDLPMPVRRVAGNAKIAATRGQVALERGPLVYCFEGIDNGGSVFDFALPPGCDPKPVFRGDLMGGVMVLEIAGALRVKRGDQGVVGEPAALVGIPYAFWNNRGLSPMAVWLGQDAANARPAPAPTLASQARVEVSFARAGMNIARINDQQMPRNATDGFAPAFDFWPNKGGTEWVAYEFGQAARVASATVSWFDDTGTGECRLPAAWRLAYRDDAGQWQAVAGASEYAIRKSEPVTVRFDPVTTKAMRLEIDLPPGFSAGLYEWEVSPAR